jgi:hypothetical protein
MLRVSLTHNLSKEIRSSQLVQVINLATYIREIPIKVSAAWQIVNIEVCLFVSHRNL